MASRNASTLVYVDHDGAKVAGATLNALAAAQKLGGDITAFVAGSKATDVLAAVGKYSGVSRVLFANGDEFRGQLPESIAPILAEAQKQFKFTHIFAPATAAGKNIFPRLAANLDVAMVSEVTGIVSEDTFQRNIYAGNALATVKSKDAVKVATIRSTAFSPASAEGGSGKVENVAGEGSKLSEFVKQELVKSERPELASASKIVCGGRALKSAENFQIMFKLADTIGAAVGATRAAVDAGYATNDMQIGQTGKIVAPSLYMAFGVSGAIQHVAGMKDAKVIVAVNKDPEAPIFQLADYGMVADLFKVVPELTTLLSKK